MADEEVYYLPRRAVEEALKASLMGDGVRIEIWMSDTYGPRVSEIYALGDLELFVEGGPFEAAARLYAERAILAAYEQRRHETLRQGRKYRFEDFHPDDDFSSYLRLLIITCGGSVDRLREHLRSVFGGG